MIERKILLNSVLSYYNQYRTYYWDLPMVLFGVWRDILRLIYMPITKILQILVIQPVY